MDAKTIFFLVTIVISVSCVKGNEVMFNFHEKLDLATETITTTVKVDTSQVIKVPELDCPLGQRRDALGNCRQRLN